MKITPPFSRDLLKKSISLLFAILLTGCATTGNEAERIRFIDTPEGAKAILPEKVLFQLGSAEFTKSAIPVFDKLKPIFSMTRDKILVDGHTDSTGTIAINSKLSQDRAEKVKSIIIDRYRIFPSKIIARGYGSTKPEISPEISDSDRQRNRRAEITFTGETVSSLNAYGIADSINNMVGEMLEGLGNAGSAIKGQLSDMFQKK